MNMQQLTLDIDGALGALTFAIPPHLGRANNWLGLRFDLLAILLFDIPLRAWRFFLSCRRCGLLLGFFS